jgi:Spy/CpxP family protein refolding chaperone
MLSKGNNTMKRTLTTALALLILSLGTLSAQPRGPQGSGGPGGPGFGGPGGGDNALADYLALTADQKAAWQTAQTELRATIDGLHDQERTLGDQLRTALEGTDATAIGNLMLQLRALRTQIDTARDAADARFAASLTADQKVKFAAFQAAVEYLGQHGPRGPR